MTDERIDALIRRLDVTTDPDPEFVRSTCVAPAASACRTRQGHEPDRSPRARPAPGGGRCALAIDGSTRPRGGSHPYPPPDVAQGHCCGDRHRRDRGRCRLLRHETRPARVGAPSPSPNATVSPSAPASPSAGPSAAVVAPRAATWTPPEDDHALSIHGRASPRRTSARGGRGRKRVTGSISAELYDPGTGTWTSTGKMVGVLAAATRHVAARRQGARGAVIRRGRGASCTTPTPEPVRYREDGHTAFHWHGHVVGRWQGARGGRRRSAVGWPPPSLRSGQRDLERHRCMDTAREYSKATLLRDGKVLVGGGERHAGLRRELYDPISGTWTATGEGPPRGGMVVALSQGYSATLLAHCKVLVAGGQESGKNQASASAELYDPQSGAWSAIQGMLTPLRGTLQRCCWMAGCS